MNVQRGSLLVGAQQARGLPIIIDVLRAFTTAAVLFDGGIEQLILVADPQEAFDLRQRHGYLLAGENGGVKIDGFDFGNSPTELLRLPPERRLYPRPIAWAGLAACAFLAFWVEPVYWLAGLGLIALGLLWHYSRIFRR